MKTEFLIAAQIELEESIAFYNEQRDELGFEFADEVEQTLERIKLYPDAWSPLSSRVRRCHVHRFPYSVIYEVRGELALIVAVQHHSSKAIKLARQKYLNYPNLILWTQPPSRLSSE